MRALKLPEEAAAELSRLATVCKEVKARVPTLAMTIDPVENRGFEYHTGISFAFFAGPVRGELGRGGRYRTGNGGGEPATGFTIYTDPVVEALPKSAPARRLFVPAGSDPALVRKLRERRAGSRWRRWVRAATRPKPSGFGCTHWLVGGKAVAVP